MPDSVCTEEGWPVVGPGIGLGSRSDEVWFVESELPSFVLVQCGELFAEQSLVAGGEKFEKFKDEVGMVPGDAMSDDLGGADRAGCVDRLERGGLGSKMSHVLRAVDFKEIRTPAVAFVNAAT